MCVMSLESCRCRVVGVAVTAPSCRAEPPSLEGSGNPNLLVALNSLCVLLFYRLSILVSFGVGISTRSKDTIFIKFILLKYFGGTLYSVISSRPGLRCYILVSEPGLKTRTVGSNDKIFHKLIFKTSLI
ncbi:hypothetical protein GQ457_09G028140 [Hibiscus cannabinus]